MKRLLGKNLNKLGQKIEKVNHLLITKEYKTKNKKQKKKMMSITISTSSKHKTIVNSTIDPMRETTKNTKVHVFLRNTKPTLQTRSKTIKLLVKAHKSTSK